MEQENPILCSQTPTIGPCSEPLILVQILKAYFYKIRLISFSTFSNVCSAINHLKPKLV
jgi:hypothetical protein